MKYSTVQYLFLSAIVLLLVSACNDMETPDTSIEYAPEEAAALMQLTPEQRAFWDKIQEFCGNAYEGTLADATPYYQSFDADQIIIHVRNCTDTLTHISLHIDDDHSRNLLLT